MRPFPVSRLGQVVAPYAPQTCRLRPRSVPGKETHGLSPILRHRHRPTSSSFHRVIRLGESLSAAWQRVMTMQVNLICSDEARIFFYSPRKSAESAIQSTGVPP